MLEYVEGPNLADLIQHDGRLPPARALQIVAQIASGLAAAQKLGIVHRDVKPGNILLARDGAAKLADMGLAVFVDRDKGSQASGTSKRSELKLTNVARASLEKAFVEEGGFTERLYKVRSERRSRG